MKLKNFVLMVCRRGDFNDGTRTLPMEMKEPFVVVRAKEMDKANDYLGCSYVGDDYRHCSSSRIEVEFRYGRFVHSNAKSKMWRREDSKDRIVFTHKYSRFSRVTRRDWSIVFDARSKLLIRDPNVYFILQEFPEW